MSNDMDPQSPGPQPNPFGDVRSGGSPTQPWGTNHVEPGGAGAQPGGFDAADLSPLPTEPQPEYVSAASGPPLPPVIEAFPGYHGVKQPPKKVAKKVRREGHALAGDPVVGHRGHRRGRRCRDPGGGDRTTHKPARAESGPRGYATEPVGGRSFEHAADHNDARTTERHSAQRSRHQRRHGRFGHAGERHA